MKEKVKIAIVLPVYNAEKWLPKCLDSLIAQTFSCFDIFAVNDGSTDQSLRLLKAYSLKDYRIKVLNKSNGGLGSARNFALEQIESLGSYDFVAFVDSDDWVSPDFLEKLVGAVVETSSDISVCRYKRVSLDEGTQWGGNKAVSQTILTREEGIGLIFSKGCFSRTGIEGGFVWNKLFRESAIGGLRFIADRKINEDEYFSISSIERARKIALVQETLYFYRQVPNSLIHKTDFSQRLIRGRELCLVIAKRISEKAEGIACAAYVDSVVALLKSGKKESVDMRKALQLSRRASELGVENNRANSRLKLFCYFPLASSVYVGSRKLFRDICFWKKH